MKPYLFWFYKIMTKRNIALVAVIGIIIVAASQAEEAPPTLANPNATGETFSSLTAAEQEYYHKSFDYALQTLTDGSAYEWRTANAFGVITAEKSFISKSKSTCRPFTESYTFGASTGEMKGIGCKREGRDGWCKLRDGDMLSCAFEPPETIFDMIELKANNAADITYNRGNRAKWAIQNLWPF